MFLKISFFIFYNFSIKLYITAIVFIVSCFNRMTVKNCAKFMCKLYDSLLFIIDLSVDDKLIDRFYPAVAYTVSIYGCFQ